MRIMPILFIAVIGLQCKAKHSVRLKESHQRFAQVYSELLQLSDRQKDAAIVADSTEIILLKHRFTAEDYQKCFKELNRDPSYWEAFYKEVQRLIQNPSEKP